MIDGYYYLHTNGDLIYKREFGDTAADLRESSFVRGLWPFHSNDRENAWSILVEALAGGANKARIGELANKWGCNNADAEIYAKHIDCKLYMDGDQHCATRLDFIDLQSSPAGFGDTALAAMAELAKELGYRPAKMWGNSFKGLLK